MATWRRSVMTKADLEALVSRGELPALTAAEEWRLPGDEEFPSPPEGYVVSLVAFHRCGFTVLAGDLIRGVLHEYELELQHLTPHGVLHMAVFVVLCEAFLGIRPHWELFRYYFGFKINEARLGSGRTSASIGCAALQMKSKRGRYYIELPLPKSHHGWHLEWFYLKNDPVHPLPAFTG